jgi:LysW-gamma-L-lysine carboxypeptidase
VDEDLELLLGLVAIPSPTGRTERITDFLIERAPAMGMEVRTDPAGNVHMSAGTGPRRVLLLCHMDTVPGRVPLRLDDGFLYGRGSVDAKGCLATAMEAASRFSGSEAGTVIVVAVPDEEGPSGGVRELVRGPAPDFVVVGEPSGWDGVTIGYKGSVRASYVHGTPAAHAGAVQRSSAELAVDLWKAVEAFCEEESAALGAKGQFDRLSPRLVSINTRDDGVTMVTAMRLDVRTPAGYNQDRLVRFLEGHGGEGDLEVLGREPPVLAEKNNPLVRALLAAIRAQGGEPRFKRKTGTSDMNVAAEAWRGVPIVAYGPGDSSQDHTPLEHLEIDEYRRAIEVLAGALGRLIADGVAVDRPGPEAGGPSGAGGAT